ncbi:unnamed protein product [Prunus armeniaca]|uniref:Uncharacterized protein n=1 Tax=Prunus armeniaca TaxID=36596 RepID=A0A6J5X3C1_PRUAR|nr:unnamed protein product [Prunus armeniaca]
MVETPVRVPTVATPGGQRQTQFCEWVAGVTPFMMAGIEFSKRIKTTSNVRMCSDPLLSRG